MVNSGLQCQEDQGIDFRSVDQLTESERPYPRQTVVSEMSGP